MYGLDTITLQENIPYFGEHSQFFNDLFQVNKSQ